VSSAAVVEAGSFRDPGGRVFSAGEAILRTVTEAAMATRLFDQTLLDAEFPSRS
jgi:hypothetical protein